MGATNKILTKRVGELTEALADVRAHAEEVKEAEDMAEVTDTADEIIEDIDGSSGLKMMTKILKRKNPRMHLSNNPREKRNQTTGRQLTQSRRLPVPFPLNENQLGKGVDTPKTEPRRAISIS